MVSSFFGGAGTPKQDPGFLGTSLDFAVSAKPDVSALQAAAAEAGRVIPDAYAKKFEAAVTPAAKPAAGTKKPGGTMGGL